MKITAPEKVPLAVVQPAPSMKATFHTSVGMPPEYSCFPEYVFDLAVVRCYCISALRNL